MAESMKSILKALVVFLVYYLCVNVFDNIVSNVGHLLFDYEEYSVHNYRFLRLPVTDRSSLIFFSILLGSFALQISTPFKKWILFTVFFAVPAFPWIISISLAALPTVTQIDVLNTAMVSLKLFLYAFVANKLVGLTIGKSHKANDYKTDEEHYLKTYNEQLENKETLKVNIIQCMTIGPPTVGKTTLKDQLLKSNKRNKKKFTEGTGQPRPPSSPVCEEVKRIQVILGDKKSGESDLIYAADESTWKTRTLDEQLVACLKKLPIKFLSSAEIIFWILFLILTYEILNDYSASTLTKYAKEQFIDKPRIISFAEYEYVVEKRHKHYKLVQDVYAVTTVLSFLPLLIMVLILTMNKIYPYLAKLISSKAVTADIAIKEALKEKNVKNIQPLFDRSFIVYFRDCGGHPEFHEVLPALSSQSTLFFLVFNLSEGLDTEYEVSYKTSNDEVSDPYKSSFTVKQALLQCLTSISSIGSYSKPHTNNVLFRLKLLIMRLYEKITQLWKKKLNLNVSNVIIIGTHKDKVSNCEEVQSIIDQLENELMHTDWYTKDMIIPTESGRLVLAVNTFNQSDIIEVKKLVNKLATNNDYQLEIPVPWLTFEYCIQKSNKKVMALEECQSIAKKSNITLGNEFDTVLWFLHNKVGTIRYFKHVPELQNVVITDTQLIFDIVTDLIVNTFSFGKRIQKRSEHDRFRSSGRFTKHHLDQCEAVREKLLSVEQVIAVLEHLVIIAPVGINESNEQEYFLPCILVHASLPSTPLLHNNSEIPPLLITFKCRYIPRGIFSSLIARMLLDSKNKWELPSDKISKNQVRFRFVKSGHLVIITNFFRFLEIAVKPPRGSSTTSRIDNVHVSIQRLLSHYLTKVRNQLNYTCTADHLFGFYCLVHNDNNPLESQIAVCNDNKEPTYIKCHNEELTVRLTALQMMWFHKNSDLKMTPDDPMLPDGPLNECHLSALLQIVNEVTDWEILGIHLGVKDVVIKDIKAANHCQPQTARKDMLVKWLRGGNAKRSDLIKALKIMNESSIVDNIEYTAD